MRVIESVAKGLVRVLILSALALSVSEAYSPAKKTVAVFPAGTSDTVILPEGTNLEGVASGVIEKATRGNERLQMIVFTRANPSVRRALNEGTIPSSMLLPPFTGKSGAEFRAVVLGRLMRAEVAVATIIDSYRFARDAKTAHIVITVETYEIATGKSLGAASVSAEAIADDEKAAAAMAAEKAAISAANEAIEFLTKPPKVGQ
jgi:hypothetical protein